MKGLAQCKYIKGGTKEVCHSTGTLYCVNLIPIRNRPQTPFVIANQEFAW